MTATPPSKLTLPPRPTPSEIAGGSSYSGSPSSPFASVPRPRRVRPSFSTVGRNTIHEVDDEAPKLPSLVPGIRPAYSTPLPTLPMVVLCIVSSV